MTTMFKKSFQLINNAKKKIVNPSVCRWKKLRKNDYNLNISRYISTAVADMEIKLTDVNGELVDLEKKITEARNTHNDFLKELGLPPLP